MLTFKELKNKIIIKNGKKYYNDYDINWFNSDINIINGILNVNNDFIFIIDNRLFDYEKEYTRDYDLKVYSIETKQIQTLYTNNDIELIKSLMLKMENLKVLNDHEKNVLLSSNINILGNSIQAFSLFYKYNLNLFEEV